MSETRAALTFAAVQRRLSFAALLAVAAVAWWFLIVSEQSMSAMDGEGFIGALMWHMMAPSAMWPYLAAAALMWVVMMVAMMIPAVLPMASIYRGIHRGQQAGVDTLLFASGYLLGWSLFALLAAALQWQLHMRGLLHGHLLATSAQLTAGLLIFAGLYQLTPLKDACLSRCRSPMGFFMQNWRNGHAGALVMGIHHGLYCIGCCWVLMLLMFAGGAMSVITMVGLSVLILAERMLPAGPWSRVLPGLLLVGWGGVLLLPPGH